MDEPRTVGGYRVSAAPVLNGRERVAFAALTLLTGAILTTLTTYWVGLPGWRVTPILHGVVTLLVGWHVVAWLLRWMALPAMARPTPPPRPADGLRVAAVTTFVPGSESAEMLQTTLTALVAMRGVHDTWVLDEGDTASVRELCARLGARHFSRRQVPELDAPSGRYASSTKHGNYNAWLATVLPEGYDVVVSFDPDHIPERHYLDRTLGYFADPAVAYVQAPQIYYNQDASWIARGAAEETYDYYSSHLMASYGLGHPIVIGCHTAHRVAALLECGGFADHDADDLLITLRYRSAGWTGVYVPEVLAAGLTPTSWAGYLRQQARWTRSVLDLKLRSLPGLAGRLSLRERALGFLHGIFYLRSLTIPAALAVIGWLVVSRDLPDFAAPAPLLVLVATSLALSAVARFRRRFSVDPVREAGVRWRSMVLQLGKWPAQLLALIQALRGERVEYTVTFKLGTASTRELMLWPQLVTAVALAEAWGVGAVVDPPPSAVRTALTALVLLSAVGLAWTETLRYPAAFDPELYRRYQAQRRGVELSPDGWIRGGAAAHQVSLHRSTAKQPSASPGRGGRARRTS